ncbi:MAG TPA: hypothetical protein VGA39_02415 [Candidatus Acidoferrales bacterium]
MRSVARVSMVLAAGAGLLLAGVLGAEEFWKKKPASAWTEKEALKVVRDSPWAKEQRILNPNRTLSTGASIRVAGAQGDPRDETQATLPPEAQRDPNREPPRRPPPQDITRASYLVRWESAGPVEDAFARLEELGERKKALAEAPSPRLPANRYVVTVRILEPAEPGPDVFDDLTLDTLRKRARLATRHGEVAASEAERSGKEAVHFFFQRDFNGKPLLDDGREQVEFYFRGDRFNLEAEFEIRKDDIR